MVKRPSADPVCRAVRELRTALGESQQAFAYRMKTAIRTIARYETGRPPKGVALVKLYNIANETGHHEIAVMFGEALSKELVGPIAGYEFNGDYVCVKFSSQKIVRDWRTKDGQVIIGLDADDFIAEIQVDRAALRPEAFR